MTIVRPDTPGLAEKLALLREEYRALYGLVAFRMTSLDRRVPTIGGSLAAFLGSVSVLPLDAQRVFLVGIPVALLWYVRLTINHARSFEDALRRLEDLEQRANRFAGEEVLGFQSGHPSRRHSIGGRTGQETVTGVQYAALTLLCGCAYLGSQYLSDAAQWPFGLYCVYLLLVVVSLRDQRLGLAQYRYQRQLDLAGDKA